jgi:signal transduction histidine kinase
VSRRITLVFVTLIAALLVSAVAPLGIALTAKERASFRFDAQSAANQVAAQAEEYLADHDPPTAMNAALASAAARGDCAAVYHADGGLVAATACGAASDAHTRALLSAVRVGGDDLLDQDGSLLRVAVPVGDDGELAGAVVLARSSDPLSDRITALWGWLVLTGIAVLALAVVLALWLARWVARPLDVLGATASRLGEGDLDARAPTDRGPREVRGLASAFNRMAARTQTVVHSHQAWVADVSHQLRTPLTALRLRLDVLAEETDGETAAELLGVQEEIGRFSRLVDGLLAVARAEGRVPRPEPVRVDAVLAERLAAWEPVARERRVVLSCDPPGPATGYLGAGDLEQMLDNILANALDALDGGGRMRAAVSAAQDRVEVRLADDGPGMGDRAKAAAFHRFGSSGTGGNGLGLAIVHRLATANGGTVALEDTPGGGLTVVLRLPRRS